MKIACPHRQITKVVKVLWYGYLWVALLVLPMMVSGQTWLGYDTDNYAGVHRMSNQPASIVSSPYKFDINIIGVDFVGLNARRRKGRFLDVFNKGNTEFITNGNVILPSLMMQLDSQSAIGISFRVRASLFTKGSNVDMTDLLISNFNVPEFFGRVFSNNFVSAKFNSWSEINLVYAREVYNKEGHKLRIGIAPKINISQGLGFFDVDDLTFEVKDANTLLDLRGDLQFGYNKGLNGFILKKERLKLFEKTSFGLNLGLEYEFGEKASGSDRAESAFSYKYKIAINYLDIGSLSYDRARNSSNYSISQSEFDINSIRDVASISALSDTLEQYFDKVVTSGSRFRTSLPGRITFQIDYRLREYVFINLATSFAIKTGERDVSKTRNFSLYTLTARYEKRKYGIMLPIYYNRFFKFNAGLAARYGPVVIGASSIITGLLNSDAPFSNYYFALKLPIFKSAFRKKKVI